MMMKRKFKFIEIDGPMTKDELIQVLQKHLQEWTEEHFAKVTIEMVDKIEIQVPTDFPERLVVSSHDQMPHVQ